MLFVNVGFVGLAIAFVFLVDCIDRSANFSCKLKFAKDFCFARYFKMGLAPFKFNLILSATFLTCRTFDLKFESSQVINA